MRSLATASLLWIAGTLPVAANEPVAFVTKLYDRYVEACSLAFTDPQAFVNTVPPNNEIGQPNVHVTDDGKLVRVFQAQNGLAESITFARHEHLLSAGCHIGPDASDRSYLANMQEMALNNGFGPYTQALADAVVSVIGSQPGIDFVGGNSPIRMSEGPNFSAPGADPFRDVDRFTHFFNFMLDIGEEKVPSLVAVHFGTAHIYTEHSIEVGQ